MPVKRKYSTIALRGAWALRSDFAAAEASRIVSNTEAGIEFDMVEESAESKPYGITVEGSVGGNRMAMSETGELSSDNKYVAVIPLMGVMSKNSLMCGPVGTRSIAARVDAARLDPNCIGTVILSDTPGGHTDSIHLLRHAIRVHRTSGKPIVANVEQMCSAGLMAGIEAEEIHMSHEHAEIGSNGVMATLLDRSEALKKEGVQQHIVYSTLSPEKNAPVQDALKGDYERLQSEVLDPIAQSAITNLKIRRPKLKEETAFQGAVFYAKEAIKIDLADDMATLDESINRVIEMSGGLQKPKQNSKTSIKNNSQTMNKLTASVLPFVLAALGTEQLVANEETGQFELEAGAAEKIMTAFTDKYGTALMLTGVAIAADGSFSATAAQLLLFEAMFGKADKTAVDKQLLEANTRIEEMQDDPETPPGLTPPPAGGNGGQATMIPMPTTSWNAVADAKPWNQLAWMRYQAAQGQITRLEAQAFEMQMNSTLVTEQMNEELGAYHRAQNTSVIDFLWPNDDVNTLFPSQSTGQYDEMPQTALFLGEFLQARNNEWAEKGGFEYQADKTKVKSYQMSYRFKEEQMFAFMHTWLAEQAGKDHPFHESFVSFLSRKIAEKVADEIRQYLFTGVYQTPVDGEAGPAKHAIQGLLAVLIRKYKENRMLPIFTGKGTYEHFVDGEPNQNHVYFKEQEVIESMPKNMRDTGPWNIYVSKDDLRARNQFEQKVIFSHPNFRDVKETYKRDNFTIHGIANWPNGAIVIAQPGMIRQGYREKGSENKVYTQREKRDTIVFLDGAHNIEPSYTGYKFKTRAELEAAKGTRQLIFTNLEFGPLSPVSLADKVTTADVDKHFAFETSVNTGATAFSKFENVKDGQTLYLIGGSDKEPTKIVKTNSNFVGLDADITLKNGVVCEFLVMSGKFVLVGMSQVSGEGIREFAQDDVSPDVSGGLVYAVNPNNAAEKVEITDLLNPAVGAVYTIHGADGDNQCKLKKGGRLALASDIAMTTGITVKLKFTNMNKFVKVN